MTSVEYIACALQELCGIQTKTSRVLDFGCGEGRLVQDLRALAFDAHGCDQNPFWPDDQNGLPRRIDASPPSKAPILR